MNTASSEESEKVADLLFAICLLLVFIMAARTPLDSDLWWHLKAGEYTIQTASPLMKDLFSYTRAGETWINHSWLGQVILYWCFHNAGYWGLGFCVALVATLSMAVLFKVMGGSAFFKSVFVVLAAIVSSFIWSPRPQIFSQLMFAILLAWLVKGQKASLFQNVLMVIFLFAFWSNLHGGYSLGIILLSLNLIGGVVQTIWREDDQKNEILTHIKRYGIYLISALAGSLLNPNGLNTLIIPFRTVGVEALQNLIDEWASPDFHHLAMQPFLILMFVGIISLAVSRKNASGFEIVGFIGFTYLALIAKRNFAPFAVFSTFMIGNHLPEVMDKISARFRMNKFFGSQKRLPGHISKPVNLMLVALLGVTALLKCFYVTHPVVVSAYEAQFYPKHAVAYLKSSGIPKGNLFNSYGWGGYLIWNLPAVKVFADGRTDLYGDEILMEWLYLIHAQDEWKKILEKWNIDWLLVEPNQPIVKYLIQAEWEVIYRDEVSIILVR